MTLGEYLLAAERLPWRDGSHDCSAWPAKWAGIPLPGYSSEAEAKALIADANGLLPLWELCIAGRLERVPFAREGDVGIIWAIGEDRTLTQVGAIFTGRRWAFLSPIGVVRASAEPVAVWRVECPRP